MWLEHLTQLASCNLILQITMKRRRSQNEFFFSLKLEYVWEHYESLTIQRFQTIYRLGCGSLNSAKRRGVSYPFMMRPSLLEPIVCWIPNPGGQRRLSTDDVGFCFDVVAMPQNITRVVSRLFSFWLRRKHITIQPSVKNNFSVPLCLAFIIHFCSISVTPILTGNFQIAHFLSMHIFHFGDRL